MATYDVAVVGTGDPDGDGFAMAYRHAEAYEELDACTIVACADLVRSRAERFADTVGGDVAVYEDHERMVSETDPDVVSVCVPPAAHAEVVRDLAASGVPDAVHCEKPMAATWGGAREMAAACERAGVELTFNHQRRFGEPFRRAKTLLDSGEIGALTRVEFAAPNLYDYGTHSVDLSTYFADEADPAWVLAGVDYREENRWFGAHNENQGLVHWAYEDGVTGLGVTGEPGQSTVGAHNRVVGTDGVVEVGVHDGPTLRVRRDGSWETLDTGEAGTSGPGYVRRAIADVVRALETGKRSELHADNALRATALVFGAYESVRRRGRVGFPLDVEDNPLDAMVEAGDLSPAPSED
ncbi:MAG: Gfo/Idh/MocA family protein [Halobacteriaceae archaeon]